MMKKSSKVTSRSGKSMANAVSTPTTAPDAPMVGTVEKGVMSV
jgi:hypothetical protein